MRKKRKVVLRDAGCFLVPRDLREKLGWFIGDTIAMYPSKDGEITLRLHAIEPNSLYSIIDETGRLTLPEETMGLLGWSKGDNLHIAETPDGEAAIVILYKKNETPYEYPGRPFRSILPGDILR